MQLYIKSKWLFFYICTFGRIHYGMPVMEIQKIVFIGAGNLATNLAMALFRKGFKVIQVCSRSKVTGEKLAQKSDASWIDNLQDLSLEGDLYIVAVSDNSLGKLVKQINVGDKLIVHTSGSMNMNILKGCSSKYGVFYPPQTFSKDHRVSFRGVPICIEANSTGSVETLCRFAASLGSNVHLVNSGQREMIHLAAIFANNFTNFMYTIAEDLLIKESLDLAILEPLIRQTAKNVRHGNLFQLQTGPAVREDTVVMKNHLALLKNHPEYKKVYDLLSTMIIQYKNQKNEL
jgi:predicted short-subunit dehydrogenase-like oxidoreductase (DUF2520 family)